MPTHPAQATQRIVPYLYVDDVADYLAFLAKASGFETLRHEVASAEGRPRARAAAPDPRGGL